MFTGLDSRYMELLQVFRVHAQVAYTECVALNALQSVNCFEREFWEVVREVIVVVIIVTRVVVCGVTIRELRGKDRG